MLTDDIRIHTVVETPAGEWRRTTLLTAQEIARMKSPEAIARHMADQIGNDFYAAFMRSAEHVYK